MSRIRLLEQWFRHGSDRTCVATSFRRPRDEHAAPEHITRKEGIEMKVALTITVLLLAGAATVHGQIIVDGDFDGLTVGSAPDCDAFAGAWGWPQNYIDNLLCEADAGELTIVATDDFDPGAGGNSLRGLIDDSLEGNYHLPSVFNQTIDEAAGLIVSVSFDIWVIDAGASGGHVYVGGDHGGGGFSNATDRGPQLSWFSDGTLVVVEWPTPTITVLTDYPVGEWQSVRMEVDMTNDTFDLYWGVGGELDLIGTNLNYRVEAIDHLDRFTVVHFGATEPNDHMYIDNVVVSINGDDCEGDANGDGTVDPLDTGFILSRFGCDVGGADPTCDTADQNGDGAVDPLDVGFVLSRFGPCDGAPFTDSKPEPTVAAKFAVPIRSTRAAAAF